LSPLFQALNKKEHKGCDSPDPECDPYMTPMTFEEKYNRMNEDYQRVLQQQNQMRVS
jgi:MADS-box transcription enhancer factor 2A